MKTREGKVSREGHDNSRPALHEAAKDAATLHGF